MDWQREMVWQRRAMLVLCIWHAVGIVWLIVLALNK